MKRASKILVYEAENRKLRSSRQGVDLSSTFRGSVNLPQMFPHPNFLMMLPKQLPADDVAIFCDNLHQTIHIFSMIPNKFGQFLHLSFQPLQTPCDIAQGPDGGLRPKLRHSSVGASRERGDNDISLHADSFTSAPFEPTSTTGAGPSIIRMEREVNDSASFLFPWRSC
jgi:hypothetical protein